MLGGGNPVGGANPSGTSSNLQYIGDHVFVTSGSVSVPTAETALIDSTTAGNSYILADIQLACLDKVSDDFDLKIKINGEVVYGLQIDNTGYQQFLYGMSPIQLVIPPQSRIEVTLTNISQDVGREWFCILTGRVYA